MCAYSRVYTYVCVHEGVGRVYARTISRRVEKLWRIAIATYLLNGGNDIRPAWTDIMSLGTDKRLLCTISSRNLRLLVTLSLLAFSWFFSFFPLSLSLYTFFVPFLELDHSSPPFFPYGACTRLYYTSISFAILNGAEMLNNGNTRVKLELIVVRYTLIRYLRSENREYNRIVTIFIELRN